MAYHRKIEQRLRKREKGASVVYICVSYYYVKKGTDLKFGVYAQKRGHVCTHWLHALLCDIKFELN